MGDVTSLSLPPPSSLLLPLPLLSSYLSLSLSFSPSRGIKMALRFVKNMIQWKKKRERKVKCPVISNLSLQSLTCLSSCSKEGGEGEENRSSKGSSSPTSLSQDSCFHRECEHCWDKRNKGRRERGRDRERE